METHAHPGYADGRGGRTTSTNTTADRHGRTYTFDETTGEYVEDGYDPAYDTRPEYTVVDAETKFENEARAAAQLRHVLVRYTRGQWIAPFAVPFGSVA